MDRALSRTPRIQFAVITPAPDGWRVRSGADGPAALYPTLEAAAGALPAESFVRLSLPVAAVIMEKMQLPSTDREELGGMAVLQLEKTLPYGGDEITSGFEILQQEQNESELLAFAVHNEALDALCAPLRARGKLPEQVGVFAAQLAARCAGEELAALIFREQESVILAVARKGKLIAAQAASTAGREAFLAELPRLLLTLELENIPVDFSRVRIERELLGWSEGLAAQFPGTKVDAIPMDEPLELGPVNLVPAAWTAEQRQQNKTARFRQHLILAGAAYLFLLLVAAGYIIWLQHQVGLVNARAGATAPAVDAIATRKGRWLALSPAIDPSRYPVEILYQIKRTISSDALHFTAFDLTANTFTVEGEAPTASMAVQYGDALKRNPELAAFHFESGPPEIVGESQRAHFRIFAKL